MASRVLLALQHIMLSSLIYPVLPSCPPTTKPSGLWTFSYPFLKLVHLLTFRHKLQPAVKHWWPARLPMVEGSTTWLSCASFPCYSAQFLCQVRKTNGCFQGIPILIHGSQIFDIRATPPHMDVNEQVGIFLPDASSLSLGNLLKRLAWAITPHTMVDGQLRMHPRLSLPCTDLPFSLTSRHSQVSLTFCLSHHLCSHTLADSKPVVTNGPTRPKKWSRDSKQDIGLLGNLHIGSPGAADWTKHLLLGSTYSKLL